MPDPVHDFEGQSLDAILLVSVIEDGVEMAQLLFDGKTRIHADMARPCFCLHATELELRIEVRVINTVDIYTVERREADIRALEMLPPLTHACPSQRA